MLVAFVHILSDVHDVFLLRIPGILVSLSLCEGVGVVKRVHTLLGGVHRLATALKVVEEVHEEVQEIKDDRQTDRQTLLQRKRVTQVSI